MSPPSKVKRVVPLVVLASLIGGAFWWWQGHHEQHPENIFYGNVDIRDVSLAFRVGGRVAAVLKREGEQVTAGEVIARLDPAPYRIALDQALAGVDAAKAAVARAEAGFRREDIAEARAVLEQRRATKTRTEDVFTRTERLYASSAVPQQELDTAKTRLDESQAGVKAAEATLDRLVRGNRIEDIAAVRADLARAEAAAAAARLSLEDAELTAPSGGTVLTRVIEPGTMLAAGNTVLVVSLDAPVWVRAFAPEPALGKLAPGTPVQVTTDSQPDHPYPGHVGYVAAQAEFTPKNVETTELRTSLVYRFRVVVDAPDSALRQGMPVTIRLEEKSPTPVAAGSAP
ncbi:MAG TPA: secretion protein HlyD [Myxococcota bacterium]|nr:secretion protein HlyD [Myxococcota bacterium]